MINPLPRLDPSVYAAAIASQSNSGLQSKELYPGVVVTQSINSGGIDLPVPYQIMFQDHIQSRLEPYALEKIISKTHPTITQPAVLIKPKPIVSASQAKLV